MKTRATIIACGACLALAAAASANPTTLYSQDFESGVIGPEWTGHSQPPQLANAPAFTQFLGRYAGGNYVTLTLDTPPRTRFDGVSGDDSGGSGGGGGDGASRELTLSFDLYAIDSWDGSSDDHGPDHFQVLINGITVFDETIANQHVYQSFRAPDVGPAPLGFRADVNDSIYRDIILRFDPGEASTFTIRFRGVGLQTLTDESWGIDNVEITYESVPTTGSASLLALAGLIAARRRRG